MKWRREDGAVLAEFAVVFPLLALLLIGIIQFGLAFSRAQGMEAAAREGARLAAIGRTVEFSDVEQAARSAAPLFITATHIDVEINGESPTENWCADAGDTVTVGVSITPGERSRYAVAIPFWGQTEPSYAANGVFRCEAPHEGGS